jgi:hypothetical protein
MSSNLIDKPDEWLKPLRAKHPFIGWSLTILLAPIALLIGIVGLLLALIATPFMGLAGLILLTLFPVRKLIKKRMIEGTITASLITLTVLGIATIACDRVIGPIPTLIMLVLAMTGLFSGFLDIED